MITTINMITIKLLIQKKNLSSLNFSYFENFLNNSFLNLVNYNKQFLYGENENGISSTKSPLLDLHIKERCVRNSQINDFHNFYTCLGLDRAISTYILLHKMLEENESYDFDDQLYKELLHFSLIELNDMLNLSNILMKQRIQSLLSSFYFYMLIYSIFLIILQFLIIYITFKIENLYQNILNTLLLLIRQLPPPSIYETKELFEIFSFKEIIKLENQRTSEIIYNKSNIPIILLGENDIIEGINETFENEFLLIPSELIGTSIRNYLKFPEIDIIDMSPDEQKSFRFYEKIQLIKKENSSIKYCNYKLFLYFYDFKPVHVDISAFLSKTQAYNGIILFIQNLTEIELLDSNLNQYKSILKNLENELISDYLITPLNNLKNSSNFQINEWLMIGIKIIIDDIPNVEGKIELGDIFSSINRFLNQYDYMIHYKNIGNIILQMPNILFSKINYVDKSLIYTKKLIEFLQDIKKKIKNYFKFYISIVTDGPIFFEIDTKDIKFEIYGNIIELCTEFLDFAPVDQAIISKRTQVLISDENIILRNYGKLILNEKTFLI